MKLDKYIFRRIEMWFQRLCFKLSGADYPFEIVYCDKKDFNGENFPSDMKQLLTHFDLEEKHFVIYLKRNL